MTDPVDVRRPCPRCGFWDGHSEGCARLGRVQGLNPMNYPTLRFFESGHLPSDLRDVSERFQILAEDMLILLEDSPHQAEVHAGLRRLLEAKDCFVRATLP